MRRRIAVAAVAMLPIGAAHAAPLSPGPSMSPLTARVLAADARAAINAADQAVEQKLAAQRLITLQESVTPVQLSEAGATPLEACIIWNESSNDPQNVTGDHEGIGQWDPNAWQQDGGTRFAPDPLHATYAQQFEILHGEGPAQQIQQQGVFDRCANA